MLIAEDCYLTAKAPCNRGNRGLLGGSSLARLLAERRGRRNPAQLPPWSVEQILDWADAFHAEHGRWPMYTRDKRITKNMQETWKDVDANLRAGFRGLPGGSSLAQLLAEHRGKRNRSQPPLCSIEQILEWADAFHAKNGRWPSHVKDGLIEGTDAETWGGLNAALHQGIRGLPGHSSLAQLLAEHRGQRAMIAVLDGNRQLIASGRICLQPEIAVEQQCPAHPAHSLGKGDPLGWIEQRVKQTDAPNQPPRRPIGEEWTAAESNPPIVRGENCPLPQLLAGRFAMMNQNVFGMRIAHLVSDVPEQETVGQIRGGRRADK